MKSEPELLEAAARLAQELARQHCRHGHDEHGEACSWNHAFWPSLRVLGLASTPDNQAELYRRAVQPLRQRSCRPRILISGAADYAMLALLAQFCHASGMRAHFVVVDLCETPLALNRWYAKERSLDVLTWRGSILDCRLAPDEEPFDLVCSHSFLGQFAPARRPALVMKWRELLRPGGRLVTATRLRPLAGPGQVRFNLEQARSFCDKVTALATASGLDEAELAEGAEHYVRELCVWPVHALDDLRGLMEEQDLVVEYLASAAVDEGNGRDLAGPTAPGRDPYAQVIALRR